MSKHVGFSGVYYNYAVGSGMSQHPLIYHTEKSDITIVSNKKKCLYCGSIPPTSFLEKHGEECNSCGAKSLKVEEVKEKNYEF